MKVAIATFSLIPDGGAEAALLRAALADLGVTAEPVVWNDPAAGWPSYDLTVIRSTWDYIDHRAEFLAWADSLPNVANPASVLRWNTDKRYLRDLAAAGVPTVPTLWDPDDLPDWDEFVVKPAVSAGSRDTARWRRGVEDEQARAHLAALRGAPAMVQPFLSAVDTEGETALVYCDGEFSHAARKAPILRAGAGVEGLVTGADGRGAITPARPTEAQLALADRALSAVPGGSDLLYARVDMVTGPDGTPVLMELELTEPSLFLDIAPDSAARFAKAIAARL
ncbi:ATP-grasp domain-containing protein [Actinomadura gamaensis]|uniref:RimK family alpha-L-glutamate ligase n=1 Tax=Actinomadura gamaensis TaxID=1763541 RepID=A0ABV9TWP8_9ACTN